MNVYPPSWPQTLPPVVPLPGAKNRGRNLPRGTAREFSEGFGPPRGESVLRSVPMNGRPTACEQRMRSIGSSLRLRIFPPAIRLGKESSPLCVIWQKQVVPMARFEAVDSLGLFGWRRCLERLDGMHRRSFLRISTAIFGAGLWIASSRSPGAEDAAVEVRDETQNPRPKLPKELLAARCPVSQDRISTEASLDYFGGKVFFCSSDCIREFKSNRSAYEARARAQLVITGHFRQVRCPLDGNEVVPGIKFKISGVDVRFCSAQCAKKFRQASPDDRMELVFVKGFSRGFAAKQEATAARRPGADADEERWECSVCGYVHRGSSPPAQCPQCRAKSDSFVRKT